MPKQTITLKLPGDCKQISENKVELTIDTIQGEIITDYAYDQALAIMGEQAAEALCMELNRQFNEKCIIASITIVHNNKN